MVRPAFIASNPETAPTNYFQRPLLLSAAEALARAQAEFDVVARGLAAAGVRVLVAQDSADPQKPDAVFPNNWVCFRGSKATLFPMLSQLRRLERRAEVLEMVGARTIDDLSPHEQESKFLEGTGAMVLDHDNRVCYANLSERADPDLVGLFAASIGYSAITFHARDPEGKLIYHTNVMLSVLPGTIVAALETVPDPSERQGLERSIYESRKELLPISFDQVCQFAGNILGLRSQIGAPLIAMSEAAKRSFTSAQIALLTRSGATVLAFDIPTIEALGGGSVRCMLAEVF